MNESTQRQGTGAGRGTVFAITVAALMWTMGAAQARPQVEISVDDAQVREGNSATFRVEMTDPPAIPNIIPVSVQIWKTETGANPVPVERFDLGHHRLWFTEGRERHSLTVRTTAQAAVNTTTTISAELRSSRHFNIMGNATATGQAVDHTAPTLNVAVDSQEVTIKEGTAAQIVIELDDTAKSDIDVNLKTEVTIGDGSHYPEIQESQLGMRTVRIYRGTRRAFVPLFVRNDNVVNDGKTVTLTLLAGTKYTLGSDSTAVITIQADTVENENHTPPDGADAATLRWDRCGEDVLVNEGDGTVSVTAIVEGRVQTTWAFKARKAGGWNQTFQAATGSDIGSDTVTADQEVAAGQRRIRVPVVIINDGGVENEESFGFELSVNGPARQSIRVDESCKLKVLRIRDDDSANISVGARVRRVVEGERIQFNLRVDNHTSSNCPIPFKIKVRAQASGDEAALNSLASSDRAERNIDLDRCSGSASFSMGTIAVAGAQGPRRIEIDLWSTNEGDTERSGAHEKIRIGGEPSTRSRYTIYIDDAADDTPVTTAATNVRLQGGNGYSEGRLEVFTNNQWGTVCDDYWRKSAADVACRSLGFEDGSKGRAWDYTEAFFGAGAASVPIHFDDVRCRGDETSLFDCRRRTGHNCRHNEDVGISCAAAALPGPGTPPTPTVITTAGANALQLNEGDTATFWIDRQQSYDTALDVKTTVSVRDRNPELFNIEKNELGERTVTIPAGQERTSITVTMSDDNVYDKGTFIDVVVQPDEEIDEMTEMVITPGTYIVGARNTSSARFRSGTYKINEAGERYFDDRGDRPVVGWEDCGQPLVVSEDVGFAPMTVETKGAGANVAYTYALVLVNMEGSASRHNDYVDADATGTLLVEGGDTTTIRNVGIVDSDQIEGTEQFEVSLFRNGLDEVIVTNRECKIKTVQIIDDDTVTMTIAADPVQTITEGEDFELFIEVVGERGDCIIPFPMDVQLTPAGDHAGVVQSAQAVVARNSSNHFRALGTGAVEAVFPPCVASRDLTWGSIVTAGDQGTRTVYFDATWSNTLGQHDELGSRVFFDGQRGGTVRYTVHIEDSEAGGSTNTNEQRNVDPPQEEGGKAPTPITATLKNVPTEHDGSNPFSFELHMTPTPAYVSYRTVQGPLFTIGNGEITKASRMVKRQHGAWVVTVQPHGTNDIAIQLNPNADCEASAAICTPEGGALSSGFIRLVPGPPVMSIADASVDEAEGVTLDFEVSLSRPASDASSVDYATSDGTARAGVDYDATAGTLEFTAGETRKTIAVAVHDDAHDEGSETLTLTLSNASGAVLGDARATGTINNTDPMPSAWMIRMGRTVGSQVVEALGERLEGGDASRVVVGGIGLEDMLKPQDPFAMTKWEERQSNEDDNSVRTMGANEVLQSTAFHLSNADAGAQGEPVLSVWGRFAQDGFKGEEQGVSTDGKVSTALMGLDAKWDRALAGVMLSQTRSEGSYELKGKDGGTVESDLTGVYPYANLALGAKVSAWVLAGAGSGELTLRSDKAGAMPTDLSMRLGAIGVRGRILDGTGRSGIALDVRSDAMWVGMRSTDTTELRATSAKATRLRVALAGERVFESERGGEFVPNAEIALRHDGGDAETGTGVEIGAGVRYRKGAFSIEGQARALIVHQAAGYRDWGLGATVRINPSASGRGMTLSIAPQWGRTAAGTHQVWSGQDGTQLRNHKRFEPEAQIAMDAGYGLGMGPKRGILTPYAGLALGPKPDYTIRAGARWQITPKLALGVEHTQSNETGEAWARAAVRF